MKKEIKMRFRKVIHYTVKRLAPIIGLAGASALALVGCEKEDDLKSSLLAEQPTKHDTVYVNKTDTLRPDTVYVPADTLFFPGDTIFLPGDTIYFPGDTIYLPGDTIYLPGDTIFTPRDTIYIPGDTIFTKPDTIYTPSKPDTIYTPTKPDTIYTPSKPDTVYIPTKPDTIYTPSKPDTIYTPSKPDTVYIPSKPDTIYLKPDTVYIEKPAIPHHNTTYIWGDNNWDAVWPADKVAASADSTLVDNVYLKNDGKSLGGLRTRDIMTYMNMIVESVTPANRYKVKGSGTLNEVGMANQQDIQDSIKLSNFGFSFGTIRYNENFQR